MDLDEQAQEGPEDNTEPLTESTMNNTGNSTQRTSGAIINPGAPHEDDEMPSTSAAAVQQRLDQLMATYVARISAAMGSTSGQQQPRGGMNETSAEAVAVAGPATSQSNPQYGDVRENLPHENIQNGWVMQFEDLLPQNYDDFFPAEDDASDDNDEVPMAVEGADDDSNDSPVTPPNNSDNANDEAVQMPAEIADEEGAGGIRVYITQQRMRDAIRDILAQEGGREFRSETFMNRIRRAIFRLEHRRRIPQASVDYAPAGEEVQQQRGEGQPQEPQQQPEQEQRAVRRTPSLEDYEFADVYNHDNDDSDAAIPLDEPEPENAVRFDTNLPAEHSYMGDNMNRVSGVNYLEVGRSYRLVLFMHEHILFPGEVLPFMVSGFVFDNEGDNPDGLLFGVCFPFDVGEEEENVKIYGITCQIYEKGEDGRGNTMIKSRALQRFVTSTDQIDGQLEYLVGYPTSSRRYGMVKVLPEIYLPEPLSCIRMGSMNRYRDIDSMSDMYKRYQAAQSGIPVHVYEQYSIRKIIEQARAQLEQHKIENMPSDPIQLSYWLVRNLHLSNHLIKTIFKTDSVNVRLKIISQTFKEEATYCCRYCGNNIANCRELFAMSKHGVQTQYCNPSGYIHETNTVYHVLPHAISYSGQPSAEFSWFPGYRWHVILCKICGRHIGWEFKALEPNMVPKFFFGISSSSVRISNGTNSQADPRAVIYRYLRRLARRQLP